MRSYLELLHDTLHYGTPKGDRTGTGTYSLFGRQLRFDLSEGFPLVTTKQVHLPSFVGELLWFISGDTNIRPLLEQRIRIWTAWPLKAYREATGEDISQSAFETRIVEDQAFAVKWGDLGPVYGAQWRGWRGAPKHSYGDDTHVDQLQVALDTLKSDPDSRRIIVSAWNVVDLPDMALAPCHSLFQFGTRPMTFEQRLADWERMGLRRNKAAAVDEAEWTKAMDKVGVPTRYLDCHLFQRSADILLGVPFNIASYALLTHMVARHVGMVPGDFVHSFSDLHLYRNHVDQARIQLAREPRPLPRLAFTDDAPNDLFAIRREHIRFDDYDPYPAISAPVAV